MGKRGVLLAISSLPGTSGVGDFGNETFSFIKILKKHNINLWQILPLNPLGLGNSPYQPYSSFAFDEIYISLQDLKDRGLISKIKVVEQSDKSDFDIARKIKNDAIEEAYSNFSKDQNNLKKLENFLKHNKRIKEYAEYITLRNLNEQKLWNKWEITEISPENPVYLRHSFAQMILFEEWKKIRKFANKNGVEIIGDIPFYVGYDSSDVYFNKSSFLLDKKYNPTAVAGVPPDYFSKNGQRWGNPIWNWEFLEKHDFGVMMERLVFASKLYDITRIDHFRAFDSYWSINPKCKTARDGEWKYPNGYGFFHRLFEKHPNINVIVEDLGDLRDEVLKLRDDFNLAGMRNEQFTIFDDELNGKRVEKFNQLYCSGTHDNETIVEWSENLKSSAKLELNHKFRELNLNGRSFVERAIFYALSRYERLIIIPMTDLLELGREHRMNIPGEVNENNWRFKLTEFESVDASFKKYFDVCPFAIGKDVKDSNIIVHYNRDDKDYKSWSIWMWEFSYNQGHEYPFNEKDEFGSFAIIPLTDFSNAVEINNVGFIVKTKGNWDKKDIEFDRSLCLSKLRRDIYGNYHIYLRNYDENIYLNKYYTRYEFIKNADFLNFNKLVFSVSNPISEYKIIKNEETLYQTTIFDSRNEFHFEFEEAISLDDDYVIEVKFLDGIYKQCKVTYNGLVHTKEFNNKFYFDGELGAIFEKNKTTFRVWSPISKSIKVHYCPAHKGENLNNSFIDLELTKLENGVFEGVVHKNLSGCLYSLIVTNSTYNNAEIIDPYAKDITNDGKYGVVTDFSKTNPKGFNNVKIHPYDRKELVIYETHIADLTSSKTWSNNPKHKKFAKKFLGACLSGTSYKEKNIVVKTGFDHIKELGVNAVQLQPVCYYNNESHDCDEISYNWGYNPLQFQALHNDYSCSSGFSIFDFSGKQDEKIKEFKTLVNEYHKAGINVILDVVFNHLSLAKMSNFDVLMPTYYFRYNEDGTLSNGSGCGNETASEMPMFRKFMIDTCLFFAKEYKIAGFRFDLMGLHDLETMSKLTEKLKYFDENIIVYGEPWCGGDSPLRNQDSCKQFNLPKYNDFGAFNDKVRNALINNSRSLENGGWAINSKTVCDYETMHQVEAAIKGMIFDLSDDFSDPNKMINYVSCHDNYTVYDRVKRYKINDLSLIKKISTLAHSLILSSNGTAFIFAGEEFLRSKNGDGNSYKSSYKTNELDYSLKIKNKDMFDNFVKLINFKKSCKGLHLNIKENKNLEVISQPNAFYYELDNKFKVFHRNGLNPNDKEILELSGYKLYLSTIDNKKIISDNTELLPYETLIVTK